MMICVVTLVIWNWIGFIKAFPILIFRLFSFWTKVHASCYTFFFIQFETTAQNKNNNNKQKQKSEKYKIFLAPYTYF